MSLMLLPMTGWFEKVNGTWKRLEHKVQDIYSLDNFKGDWTNANESTIALKLKWI